MLERHDFSDEKLVFNYLKSDEKSLEVLIQRYLKLIYNYVYRRVNNYTEAEDITQEVFLKVWRNIKKFDQNKKFKSWIFTIAKNTTIDWLKKKKTLSFSNFIDKNGNNSLENKLISRSFVSENNLAYITEGLSPQCQKIISLHNDHGFTFKEIAEILNESINTTKSKYHRAIMELRGKV